MNAKYADVIGSPEVIAYINRLPGGLFELPVGIALIITSFRSDKMRLPSRLYFYCRLMG
jgi:hypothetical protein